MSLFDCSAREMDNKSTAERLMPNTRSWTDPQYEAQLTRPFIFYPRNTQPENTHYERTVVSFRIVGLSRRRPEGPEASGVHDEP